MSESESGRNSVDGRANRSQRERERERELESVRERVREHEMMCAGV